VQLEKEILDSASSSGSSEYATPSQSSDEAETESSAEGTAAGDSSNTSNTTKINGTNMTISLDGLQASIDPSKFFTRAYGNMRAHQAALGSNGYNSAPPTAHAHCPTCGKSISDPLMFYNNADYNAPLSTSPLVVPMGPLAAAAFESGMSAVEELKLLKAQVQDVARVCNAVARGDLSQKITVPVQGVVMVQLKDVINTMVCIFPLSFTLAHFSLPGRQIGSIRKGGYTCITGSRNRRVRTTSFLQLSSARARDCLRYPYTPLATSPCRYLISPTSAQSSQRFGADGLPFHPTANWADKHSSSMSKEHGASSLASSTNSRQT
jgi:hypothetical protein